MRILFRVSDVKASILKRNHWRSALRVTLICNDNFLDNILIQQNIYNIAYFGSFIYTCIYTVRCLHSFINHPALLRVLRKAAPFSLALSSFSLSFSSSASFHIDVVMLSGGGFVVLFAFWNVVLIFGRRRGEGWGDGGSNHLGAADQDALALSFRERFSNAFFRQTDGFNRRFRRDFKHRVG